MKNLLFASALLSVGCANAQTVINADEVDYQPLIVRDASGFKRCGVRVVAMVSAGTAVETYDFSINVQIEPIGSVLKAGKYKVTLRPGQTPSFSSVVSLPAPVGFWAATTDQAIPMTLTNLTPSENSGFILGVADFASGAKLILESVAGRQMQFVVRYKNERLERIISFTKTMAEPDMTTLNACFTGLSDRLSVLAKEKTKHAFRQYDYRKPALSNIFGGMFGGRNKPWNTPFQRTWGFQATIIVHLSHQEYVLRSPVTFKNPHFSP